MNLSFLTEINEYIKRRRHHRFLSLYDLPETGSVLDVSCGDGDFLSVLASYFPQLDLHGIDMNEEIILRAREKFPVFSFSHARAESLPYPDRKFAAVISAMSFHHYAEPRKVLEQIARVLHPEGTLYLLDLIPRNRMMQFFWNFDGCPEPYHFEKYCRVPEITGLAQDAGLVFRSNKSIEAFSGARLLKFTHF